MLEDRKPLSIKRSVFLSIDRQIARCYDELKAIYWTVEMEELKKRWNMREEEINNVKNNIKYVK
jgi:hypothetical protein